MEKTRCVIVDAEGKEVLPGIIGKNPQEAIPHIGEKGYAEDNEYGVKITLDSGETIYGYECWWKPIKG